MTLRTIILMRVPEEKIVAKAGQKLSHCALNSLHPSSTYRPILSGPPSQPV